MMASKNMGEEEKVTLIKSKTSFTDIRAEGQIIQEVYIDALLFDLWKEFMKYEA